MRGEQGPRVTQGGWGAPWALLELSGVGILRGARGIQIRAMSCSSMRGTWPLMPEIFVLGSFEGSCVVLQASAHGLGLQSLCSGEMELILEQGLLLALEIQGCGGGRRAAWHRAMAGCGGIRQLPLSLGAAGQAAPS